jgi:HSP20 family protein
MLYPTFYRRSDPFALMRSMLRDFEGTYPSPSLSAPSVFPAVNVWEGDDAVAVTAELPGVETDSIDITVKDNVLTLSGERKPPEVPDAARWHRNERSYGRFSRAIRLPFHATDDRVEARLQNGVLRIVIGRPEEDKPKRIEIKAA